MSTTAPANLTPAPDAPSTPDDAATSRPTSRGGDQGRLAHLPVSFFAVVMGIGGLALAWLKADAVYGVGQLPGRVLAAATAVVFLTIGVAYLAKWARHSEHARAELAHPVRLSFVPTSTIALLILATALAEDLPGVAGALWWVGSAGQLGLTLYVLNAWLSRPTIQLGHVTPAWFIPVVGTIVVPLAGTRVGSVEVSWFFFSFGMVFWVALLPLVMGRLLVHPHVVPGALLPTLAVLVAPPAVAMVSWLRLVPDSGPVVPTILFNSALGFLLVVLARLSVLVRLPFAMPWWAYTFPMGALTVAALSHAERTESIGYDALAWALLAATSALVAAVGLLTVRAMARHEICVPESSPAPR